MKYSPAVLVLSLTSLTSISHAAEMKLLPPESGIYHGIFPDLDETDSPLQVNRKVREYESQVGSKAALVTIDNHWFRGIDFPLAKVREIHAMKKIPVVEIMPWVERRRDIGPDPVFRLERLISGGFDHDLTQYAYAVQDTQQPVVLSFAPEMNGAWYPWSGAYNGANVADQSGDPNLADGPELYRDAYRHIIQLFRRHGVQNVTWVFHFTAVSRPNESWNDPANYYPGDDMVDWVGVSSYSAQQTRDVWEDFTIMMDEAYTTYEQFAPTKPFAVLEFGTIEDPLNPYRKSDWIANALSSMHSGRYSQLKAMIYWNESSWDQTTNAYNLRIDSSTAALNAYVEGLTGGQLISAPRLSETQEPGRPTQPTEPSRPGQPTQPEIQCYCGYVNVNGISHCSAWRPGDKVLKEYRRFNRCDVGVCKAFFSAETQAYCNNKYIPYPG
jgi:hypothetical protein